jgi:hypothetical protein
MVILEHKLTDAEAPHVVDFTPIRGSGEGQYICHWLETNGTGQYRSNVLHDQFESHVGWTFRFTDADTAFWFRMRFGGRD